MFGQLDVAMCWCGLLWIALRWLGCLVLCGLIVLFYLRRIALFVVLWCLIAWLAGYWCPNYSTLVFSVVWFELFAGFVAFWVGGLIIAVFTAFVFIYCVWFVCM